VQRPVASLARRRRRVTVASIYGWKFGVLQIDYSTDAPHSALGMRSPVPTTRAERLQADSSSSGSRHSRSREVQHPHRVGRGPGHL